MHRPLQRPRVFSPGWRALLAALAVVAVAATGWVWLRDSSLVRVKRVHVTGLSSPDEGRIRRALHGVARDMTTLNVREDALRDAVSSYPSVTAVETRTDFPHELTILVHERRQVAVLDLPGGSAPVAPDGAVLTGMATDPRLPVIRAARGAQDRRVSALVSLLARAPAPLLRRSSRAWHDRRGLVVALRDGPTLVFGDRGRPRAKWAAAARVLAEPSARGAVYLDVRVPERVAAGGIAGPTVDLDSSLSENASPIAQVQPD